MDFLCNKSGTQWGFEAARYFSRGTCGCVPLSAGQVYHQAIQGSRLEVIENCGHRPEVEQTEQFVRLVQDFLSEA